MAFDSKRNLVEWFPWMQIQYFLRHWYERISDKSDVHLKHFSVNLRTKKVIFKIVVARDNNCIRQKDKPQCCIDWWNGFHKLLQEQHELKVCSLGRPFIDFQPVLCSWYALTQGSTHRLIRAPLGASWCDIFRFLLVLVGGHRTLNMFECSFMFGEGISYFNSVREWELLRIANAYWFCFFWYRFYWINWILIFFDNFGHLTWLWRHHKNFEKNWFLPLVAPFFRFLNPLLMTSWVWVITKKP